MRIALLDNEEITKQISIKDVKVILKEKKRAESTAIHDYALSFEQTPSFYKPEWIQKWAKTEIQKKSVREHFIYKKKCLWYFIEYFLYMDNKVIPYNPTGRLLYYIDVLEEIFKKEKPQELIIQNEDDALYSLAKQLARKRKIRVQKLNIKSKESGKKLWKKEWLVIPALRVYNLFRGLLGKRAKNKLEPIILLSNERFCRESNEKNLFWGALIKEFNRRKIKYSVLEYDVPWQPKSFQKMLSRHLFKGVEKTQYHGKYLDREARREINDIHRFCKQKSVELKGKIWKRMIYKGIDIYPYFEKRWEYVLNIFSFFLGDLLAITRRIAERERPQLIMMDHEFNSYGLGFLLHTKEFLYKTLALQYESVNPRTCIHRYITDKTIQKKENDLWRPFPDVKCVSGSYAQKILLQQCNYQKSHLKITGQPRFDNLVKKKVEKEKTNIYRSLGLDSKKKTIVYVTKFRSEEEPVWKKIQEIVQKREDLQLIFKLAPFNKAEQYTPFLHPGKKVVVTQRFDLHKILDICDLLISVRSTVIMEAMSLDKPVLLVDYNKTSQFPYEEMGAIFPTSSLEELEPGIESCFKNQKIKKKLAEGRKRFLTSYLYKQDGKAAERVARIVEKLLKGENI